MLPTNVDPAPIVAGVTAVAGSSSPTCQNTRLPPQVFAATTGATSVAPGLTVNNPSTWKIHGPPPVSVRVVLRTASPLKQ